MGHDNDIEDLEAEGNVRNTVSNSIKIQSRRMSPKLAEEKKSSIENYLPGSQRVWLKTYGCSHNVIFILLACTITVIGIGFHIRGL